MSTNRIVFQSLTFKDLCRPWSSIGKIDLPCRLPPRFLGCAPTTMSPWKTCYRISIGTPFFQYGRFVCVCACVCRVCVLCMHTYTHAHIHTYKHTHAHTMHACIHTCMHTYIHSYMHTYTYIVAWQVPQSWLPSHLRGRRCRSRSHEGV